MKYNYKIDDGRDGPIVKIYDADYTAHASEYGFCELGQFVSSYYVKTFMKIKGGLDLNSGVPKWTLNERQVKCIQNNINTGNK